MVVTTVSAADDSDLDRTLLLIADGRATPLLVGDQLVAPGSAAVSDDKENLGEDEEEDDSATTTGSDSSSLGGATGKVHAANAAK
jgi:hypothetical protein